MTPTTPEPARLAVALSTSDVSVVFDVSDGALPAVVHWGERLRAGTRGPRRARHHRGRPQRPQRHRRAASRGRAPGAAPGVARASRPPGVAGRSGLEHALRGRLDPPRRRAGHRPPRGRPRAAGGARRRRRRGASSCAWTSPSTRPASLRARASVTNVGHDPFTVDGVALAMPLPAGHDELLDFARPVGQGTHAAAQHPAHRHPPA